MVLNMPEFIRFPKTSIDNALNNLGSVSASCGREYFALSWYFLVAPGHFLVAHANATASRHGFAPSEVLVLRLGSLAAAGR